ncbi:MAG: nucleoside phosphorylase [Phycisphaerales bacterium]|nr:nucleoside phosphorylase [Phycisphaerales bacterium]
MVRRRFIILTAVQIEAKAVARALGLRRPSPTRPTISKGTVPLIELHLIGISAPRLPQDLGNPDDTLVIMAGLAGGLDPSLQVGDVVIDDSPPGLVLETSHRAGRIHSADAVIATTAQKAALFAQTRALAVDMETATVRTAVGRQGIPFLAIRAISDAADDVLDPAVLRLVDAFGRPRPIAIAATLIRRPGLAAYLKWLGASSRLAADNLGLAVAGIVRSSLRPRVDE